MILQLMSSITLGLSLLFNFAGLWHFIFTVSNLTSDWNHCSTTDLDVLNIRMDIWQNSGYFKAKRKFETITFRSSQKVCKLRKQQAFECPPISLWDAEWHGSQHVKVVQAQLMTHSGGQAFSDSLWGRTSALLHCELLGSHGFNSNIIYSQRLSCP